MMTEEKFGELEEKYQVCNIFSLNYKKENPGAVIKYGETDDGDLHCWIYDPEEDWTIDPTMEQFFEENILEVGDNHPLCKEINGFEDAKEFVDEFGGEADYKEIFGE